jgi:Sec-independent protein secretion pathway component TatC
MALVMGPMVVLYFFGILLAKVAERGRNHAMSEQEIPPDSISTPS